MSTKDDYAGNILYGSSSTELTDAAATAVLTIKDTEGIQLLSIDVTGDKDCTVDVVRYLDEVGGFEGAPGEQGSYTGGTPKQFKYTDLACKAAKITVTKTEAGTSDGFSVFAYGQAG